MLIKPKVNNEEGYLIIRTTNQLGTDRIVCTKCDESTTALGFCPGRELDLPPLSVVGY